MVNAISIGSPIVIGFSVNKEMDAEGITITVPFSFRQPDIKNNMGAVINIKKTSLYFIYMHTFRASELFFGKTQRWV
jgi:hypothetical protein